MTEEQKSDWRFNWRIGYEDKPIALCKYCMATIVVNANMRNAYDELQTRRERIDNLIHYVDEHMDFFKYRYRYDRVEALVDQEYSKEIEQYLKKHFVDKEQSIMNIEDFFR